MISLVTTTSSSLQIAGPLSVSSGGGGGGMVFCKQHYPLRLEAFSLHLPHHRLLSFSSSSIHRYTLLSVYCDRHIGQLAVRTELQSHSSPPPLPESDFALSQAVLFLVCYYLSALGYCVGLSKSITLCRCKRSLI